MTDNGCWTSEYDWEVELDLQKTPLVSATDSRETVLCVLFDDGAQRQFSSVRITLSCSNDVTPEHHEAWRVIPHLSSLSVVNRVPSESQDTPVTQNAHSLPICDIVFMTGQHSARSQTTYSEAKVCGELVLAGPGSQNCPSNTIFEFDQPLTENTQSVSVSFTSSRLLCTMMTHGVFSDPSFDYSATVGRVVRVLPTNKRKTTSLPIDVLLLIFENLRFPPTYRSWRNDVLSSALVCREWTCALSTLLVDFRSEYTQLGHPPEIASFTNGLVACPSLALGIKHLSVCYLEKHPTWDPFPELPSGDPTPMFVAILQLRRGTPRRLKFSNAFFSILNVAKNIQNLSLVPAQDLLIPPDDLADALRRLNKLEIFRAKCTLTMVQLLSCIAAWPSLKSLYIMGALPPVDQTLPLVSLSCCLTTIELLTVPIKDDELACLVSASGSTLERLRLMRVSQLTNAGLGAALSAVCTSLTYFSFSPDTLARDEGEERALDAIITRMERLTRLEIDPQVASERMLERRAEAFIQCTTRALPVVHLCLLTLGDVEDESLVAATRGGRVWPGWACGTALVIR
ncbi:hypothetical protein HD554DRAFT_682626 [Boletus coccyginus]|nr:hypothetical protein HD554DRAFT_682626 [Boletus coccyginus]